MSFNYYEEVEVELNKFFGDPKSGSYSLLDRFKLESLKQHFIEEFQKIYNREKEIPGTIEA